MRASGPVAATGQRPPERLAGRAEQQFTGVRHPAADDEQPRVERGGEVREADAEPAPDVLEQLDRARVALARAPR